MARNWAITIGINGYRYLQRLNYAVKDADAVRQFFSEGLGFHQVYHFTDVSEPIQQDRGPALVSQPTATTLRRFLRTRFEEPFLRDGDNLWFFFAGHGIRHENRDYLMPQDGDRGDLENSAIPLHYISERLRRSGADNVILLIDACRSDKEGRRDGFGFGAEKQQGVITIFSCSPEEPAYEIEELQQGAFTHALLESLRLQGEGNCATVERLYQRLRYTVPQLTHQYKRVLQTPYGMIEPPSKNHLILLPRQATLTDVLALKYDALSAESRDPLMAKQLWIRVLIVSPGDPEAIAGIDRLALGNSAPPIYTPPSASVAPPSQSNTYGSRPVEAPAPQPEPKPPSVLPIERVARSEPPAVPLKTGAPVSFPLPTSQPPRSQPSQPTRPTNAAAQSSPSFRPSSSRIFISYRRDDASAEAGRIYDHLEKRFKRKSIFKDVDAIDMGDNFRDRIQQAVEQCEILLAVMGKNWLQVKDAAGNRRLDNPADWVRFEIETALARNIRVIPILLDGVEMPEARSLPSSLRPLVYLNAARVRNDPDFRRDMNSVMKRIRQQLKPPFLSSFVSRRQAIQILGFAGGGIGSILLGRAVLQSNDWKLPELEPATTDGSISTFNVATVNVSAKTIDIERKQAEFRTESLGGDSTLDLMLIPGGSFQMGSHKDEGSDDERPEHNVVVKPFLMGLYQVTQAQWRAVAALTKVERDLEAEPSSFKGDSLPVEQVSWDDAVEFCQRLSKHTKREYRLPSEAEWEYSCRAGTKTPFNFGETITTDIANYRGTALLYEGKTYPGNYGSGPKGVYRDKTTDVGIFPANSFGLYDMHGNVWEWCQDHWHENYQGAPEDGSAWRSADETAARLMRGGALNGTPDSCRSAARSQNARDYRDANIGFRVICASSWPLA
jgi:formylglycine-generating enzyme required for sulfatase activity/uncharacterized caspase-like protein